ncbi:MAG: hypothetical protein ACFFEF_06485 [Candidatus Thorarchaeota archaeon]
MSPATRQEPAAPLKGLNHGEVIEWNQEAGLSIVIFVVQGCLPLILAPILIAILSEIGREMGTVPSIIANFLGLATLLAVALYILYMYIQVKRTEYFITNQRLLEVRGKSIINQIPRANIENLAPEQFIKQKLSHRSPGDEHFNFTITDPVTGVAIRMTAMHDDVVSIVSRWSKKHTR